MFVFFISRIRFLIGTSTRKQLTAIRSAVQTRIERHPATAPRANEFRNEFEQSVQREMERQRKSREEQTARNLAAARKNRQLREAQAREQKLREAQAREQKKAQRITAKIQKNQGEIKQIKRLQNRQAEEAMGSTQQDSMAEQNASCSSASSSSATPPAAPAFLMEDEAPKFTKGTKVEISGLTKRHKNIYGKDLDNGLTGSVLKPNPNVRGQFLIQFDLSKQQLKGMDIDRRMWMSPDILLRI